MQYNVTKIQKISNKLVLFWNGSELIRPITIINQIDTRPGVMRLHTDTEIFEFSVYNITEITDGTTTRTYTALNLTSTDDSAYKTRFQNIFQFLVTNILRGCCCDDSSPSGGFAGLIQYTNSNATPISGEFAFNLSGSGKLSINLVSGYGQDFTSLLDEYSNGSRIWFFSSEDQSVYTCFEISNYALAGANATWDASVLGGSSTFTDGAIFYVQFDEAGTGGGGSGTVTSVGLTMPSAFNVSGSPITNSGTLAVAAAGLSSQYIRGDGTLANFPTSIGWGASVNYYLNGSVNQGVFGGNTYREMNRVPVIGLGTNFTIATNGYIAQFITDANDPSQLNIPAGNWNFEMYFQASSSGGSPSFYVELYKWDGAIFTLIASSSANPEGITNGTTVDLYLTALSVPPTTLALTDRLAVRVYVNNSGRTITLHTEDSNLCEVITTFTTGLTALNGLTAQVQNLAVGTSGTDFNISSVTATHTFNLPTASATNRGALSSADWTTFNDKAPLASPAFTGIPTAPTAAIGTNTAQLATTQFVQDAIAGTTKITAYGVKMPGVGLTAGATNFTDFYGSSAYSATESTRFCVAGVTGTIQTFDIYIQGAQPVTGSLTANVRVNAVTSGSALIIAAGSAAGVYSISALGIAIIRTDVLNYRIQNSALSSSAAIVSIASTITT